MRPELTRSPEATSTRGSFITLIAVMLLSYLAAALYTVYLNPEVSFWKTAYENKRVWSKEISTSGPKTVFVGGSSCAFQIDAGILTQKHGMPSVNMGMHAGTGAPGILAIGLSVLNPGDKLMLCIEPALLTDNPGRTPLGYQMLTATGLLFQPGRHWMALQGIRLGEALSALRPGLYHSVTMAAKVLAGRPLYRYGKADLRAGGAMSTAPQANISPVGADSQSWSPESKRWIESITTQLKISDNIQTAYLLPLALFQPKEAEEARRFHHAFLDEAPHPIQSIRDEAAGVATNALDFADSAQHLTTSAMENRTTAVARLILNPPSPQPTGIK